MACGKNFIAITNNFISADVVCLLLVSHSDEESEKFIHLRASIATHRVHFFSTLSVFVQLAIEHWSWFHRRDHFVLTPEYVHEALRACLILQGIFCDVYWVEASRHDFIKETQMILKESFGRYPCWIFGNFC